MPRNILGWKESLATLSDEALRNALNAKPNATTRELATTLGVTHMAIGNHLNDLGYRKVYSTWVPHRLGDSDKASRVGVCESLLLRPHRKDLLKEIVTGDESWVLDVDHTRKSQWLPRGELPPHEPKPGFHEKKVLLCCWWDSEGMLYYELLPTGTTVTAVVYAARLQKLAGVIQKERPKRDKVLLLHDNARPHVAKMTRQTISELDWEVLPHPAYSPDLAPSDYHLFRALKNHLRDKAFDDRAQLENDVGRLFASRSPEFWAKCIEQLPVRWEHVIDNNGHYIVD